VMTVVATVAKYLAAWLTQKTFRFSADERRLIFGLSNAQAAATLAAVLVGYNIITGTTETGEPIRLLNEAVLNGTIVMILITCTIASFSAQKGARNTALAEASEAGPEAGENQERILIPVSNIETTEELINLGLTVKSGHNKSGLYALNIVNNNIDDEKAEKQARKLLNKAAETAVAADNTLYELLRYDLTSSTGSREWSKNTRSRTSSSGCTTRKAFPILFWATSPRASSPNATPPP
ncbi:MAG TPA: hypothetical protein PKE06_26110, partial [Flavilitoribacter sp.]|nr:hypothetical protein [Flavilitoribacter sp.]